MGRSTDSDKVMSIQSTVTVCVGDKRAKSYKPTSSRQFGGVRVVKSGRPSMGIGLGKVFFCY